MINNKIDLTLDDAKFKKVLSNIHPSDLALEIKDLTDSFQQRIIQNSSLNVIAKTLTYLTEDDAVMFYHNLADKQKKQVLNHLKLDELIVFLECFLEEEQKEIVKLVNEKTQEQVNVILAYDEKLAASLMTTEFLTINYDMTIKEATSYVTENTTDKSYVDIIFVLKDEKYYGALLIKDLIIARKNDKLEDIIDVSFPAITEHDTINKAIHKIKDYDLNAIPIINTRKNVLGIITSDDAFYEETKKLETIYQQMALLGEDYDEKASAVKRSLNRLPWLIFSVILNLLIASVLTVFERTLEEVVALILFQPMILGMAGNIGTQSLAVTILGLNKKEKLKVKKHIIKEILISITNGLITGIVASMVVFIFLRYVPNNYDHKIEVSFIVGISLFLSMIISALAGVLLPLGLNKLGLDEKAASGPLISTINDFAALGIYFLTATLLLVNI